MILICIYIRLLICLSFKLILHTGVSLVRASELIITNAMFRVGYKYLTDCNIQRGKASGFKGNIMFLLGFF